MDGMGCGVMVHIHGGDAADQIVAVLPVSHFDRICIDLEDVSEREKNSRTVSEHLL
jgi:hypothetical protein